MPRLTPHQHTIRITGRGRCGLLVDSDCIIDKQQVTQPNLTALANVVCEPFKIPFKALAGDGPQLQQYNVALGETVFEILTKFAAYSGLLLYEQTDGSLVSNTVGTQTHKTGVTYGANLERGQIALDGADRFSDYWAAYMTTDNLIEVQGAPGTGNVQTKLHDDGMPKDFYKIHVIVSPQSVNGAPIATKLAMWEMARRRGRSQQVHLTVDSWRDQSGQLWQPNWLIRLQIAPLYIPDVTWVITEVTYRYDETGTHADLTCMPAEGLTIQPSTLFAFDADISQAIDEGDQLNQQPPTPGVH